MKSKKEFTERDRIYLQPLNVQRAAGEKGFFIEKWTVEKTGYMLGHTDADPLNRVPAFRTRSMTISKTLYFALKKEALLNTKRYKENLNVPQ